MRHFKLVNSNDEELDITSVEYLFHEISGLGFEEENDFRQIGDFFLLNRTGKGQGSVSGKMMFTDNGELTPYEKYYQFVRFINKSPLTLKYNPHGPITESVGNEPESYYRRTVRVSSLEKSELNQYGVLDCDITFVCYTPWFNVIVDDISLKPDEITEENHWIWAGTKTVTDPDTGEESTVTYPPLVFEPQGVADEEDTVIIPPYSGEYTPAIFTYEVKNSFDLDLDIADACPTKITIFGPLLNPSWIHRVTPVGGTASEIVGTGGFSQSVSVGEDDRLVIDGTAGKYQIYMENSNGTVTDLYAKRDFGQDCFINFKEGSNQIIVTSTSGTFATHMIVERHIYHATV